MSKNLKKIKSGAKSDLRPNETVWAGIFLNPDGFTKKLVAKEVAGVVGAGIAARRGTTGTPDEPELVTDRGIAALFPETRIWVAVTNQRTLVWGHSVLSGKPKGLLAELPATAIQLVDLEPRTATFRTTLRFSDGTAMRYEAPKLMNDPESFAAALPVWV
jgi:hypothetical protein